MRRRRQNQYQLQHQCLRACAEARGGVGGGRQGVWRRALPQGHYLLQERLQERLQETTRWTPRWTTRCLARTKYGMGNKLLDSRDRGAVVLCSCGGAGDWWPSGPVPSAQWSVVTVSGGTRHTALRFQDKFSASASATRERVRRAWALWDGRP